MGADLRRFRAEKLIELAIRGSPGGVPTIVLVDRLHREGFTVREASEHYIRLQAEGRIRVVAGRWVMNEPLDPYAVRATVR